MSDMADLKEKYVVVFGKSFGLTAGDSFRLTIGDLEPYIDREPHQAGNTQLKKREFLIGKPHEH